MKMNQPIVHFIDRGYLMQETSIRLELCVFVRVFACVYVCVCWCSKLMKLWVFVC